MATWYALAPTCLVVCLATGCASTFLLNEEEQQRHASTPMLAGVLEPCEAQGRPHASLIIRYTVGENSFVGETCLYAVIPTVDDSHAAAPFGYVGNGRTGEAVAADLRTDGRLETIEQAAPTVLLAEEVSAILRSPHFRSAGRPGAAYWARTQYGTRDMALIAFRLARAGDDLNPQDFASVISREPLPTDATVFVVPTLVPLPDDVYSARMARATALTPFAFVAFDVFGLPIVLISYVLGQPIGH